MSAKRRSNQDSKTHHQNSKNTFRPSSAQHSKPANSSGWKSNLRKNRIGSFEDLNFGGYFRDSDVDSKSEDSSNSSDFENNEETVKGHRSKKCVGIASKKNFLDSNEKHTSPKVKHRKDPLPMKLRAFPQSFWQQPNKTPTVSPGTVYGVPLPLSKEENSSENKETLEEIQTQERQETISKPNVELLFSLFRSVEEEQRKSSGQRNIPLVRRGRPKKSKAESSKVIRDEDPYLTSSAAEFLLPLIPTRFKPDSLQSRIYKEEQILAMVSIDGSSNLLSSINAASQNYSQILSELVVQL